MSEAVEDFATRLRSNLASYANEGYAEFDGTWYAGSEMSEYADRIEHVLAAAGIDETTPVAVVVRNRVQHAAVILDLVASPRSFSMVYAFQSPASMAKDIVNIAAAAVIADVEDWTPRLVDAARSVGSLGISIGLDGERVSLVPGLEVTGPGPFAPAPASPSVEVLTSGTTGRPKRIQIKSSVLERAAFSASAFQTLEQAQPPDLVFWPFGNIGGVCQLAGALHAGKRMVVLERFTVPAFVDAIKRHQIRRVGVQPVVIRMLLAAEVPKEDLASLELIFGGSGPLEPELQDRFEATYDIPILWAYGATEFAGTILAWTPDLAREFKESKRGSVGRVVPGAQVRVVDGDTGAEVPIGSRGLLEALVPQVQQDWIRTTDLASIDTDGFVTLHGRDDGAINRGGFKVLPEVVVDTLRRHPAVLDAAVIGVSDPRLGEVPIAAVELIADQAEPSEDELKDHVREHLPAHHIPVRVHVVPALPRTPSLKVSLGDLRELLA